MPFERTLGMDGDTAASTPAMVKQSRDLASGTQVGRYIIESVVGRGGMGVVYAAHDPTLDRRVALKLLHESIRPEHLVREAQALAKLDDPHVVTVFDAGELDGHVFIAMKLVDGEDLLTALAQRRPSPAQILAWFVAAGRGLAAAHAAGLVHRDFKPGNVLIDRRGGVAVTDFGLAHSTDPDAQARMTGIGVIAGTPAYMAPEQHALEAASEASDQFSFCVALWDALFRQHPYIAGSREAMSPFEIGAAILDGVLIPPPRSRVSRRVVDALARGLSRTPAERWPSMVALLDVLAPPPRRSVWPIATGAVLLLAVGGGIVWALQATEHGATCETTAADRAAAVWSPAMRVELAARFAHTDRSYASSAAAQASAALDRYADSWRELASDTCTAEAGLAVRRRACLDNRLEAMRALVGVMTGEARAEFVDHAQAMVAALPELAPCADAAALLAVPPALADKVAAVERELATAIARGTGGDYETARAMLALAAGHAEAIGWAPLVARAHLAFGEQQVTMSLPARDELAKAAELATANHLDREAATAWADSMVAAAADHAPDAVNALLPIARGAAARVAEPALVLQADIAYGRALLRLGAAQEASERCRAALATARERGLVIEADEARNCLVDALVSLGAYGELQPIAVEQLAATSKRFGPTHPKTADMLAVMSAVDQGIGKLAEAQTEAQQAYDICVHAYPPRHVKIAQMLERLAELADNARIHDAEALYAQALDIAREVEPPPIDMIAKLDEALAYIAYRDHRLPASYAFFDEAIALLRDHEGPDSLVLAIRLLNYGQLRSSTDFQSGVGMLFEGQQILERRHDPRALIAGSSLAMVLVKKDRFAEAQKLLESGLANAVEARTDPENVAKMKYALAQAIAGVHGDRARVHALAKGAIAELMRLGSQPDLINTVTAWLAKQP